MDYYAQFSAENSDGYFLSFSMLVSASDVESAIEKFKEDILNKRKVSEHFNETNNVYLQIIHEVSSCPDEPALLWYEVSTHSGVTINTFLTRTDNIESFKWYPDGEEYNKEKTKPFISFKDKA